MAGAHICMVFLGILSPGKRFTLHESIHTHTIYPSGNDDLAKDELLLKSSRYAHTDTHWGFSGFSILVQQGY